MDSSGRASLVAATSVGVVEALKDRVGLCRWNYAFESLHRHYDKKYNLGSSFQASRVVLSPSSSSSSSPDRIWRREEAKRSEESLRKVMYLSCWGPNY